MGEITRALRARWRERIMARETPDQLLAEADRLEAEGHAVSSTDCGESLKLWAQADKLRARAADLEAARIDWRHDLQRRVHEAALVALYTRD